MVMANIVTLIAESPEAHGILETPTTTERDVFCTVKSVGYKEAYEAMGIGLTAEIKVIIPHYIDYNNERYCKLNGIDYKVIRTYISAESVELTLARKEGNANE